MCVLALSISAGAAQPAALSYSLSFFAQKDTSNPSNFS